MRGEVCCAPMSLAGPEGLREALGLWRGPAFADLAGVDCSAGGGQAALRSCG
jgi:hypothetical protein